MADLVTTWTRYVRTAEAARRPPAPRPAGTVAAEGPARAGGGRQARPRGESPFDAYAPPLRTWEAGDPIAYEPDPYGAAMIATHASGAPVDVSGGGVIQLGIPSGHVHVIPLTASTVTGGRVVTTRLLLVPADRLGATVQLVLPDGAAADEDALAAVGGWAGWDGGGELTVEVGSGRSVAVTWVASANFWVLHS